MCVLLGLLLGLRGSALAALLVDDVLLREPGSIRVRATVLKRALQPRAMADWLISRGKRWSLNIYEYVRSTSGVGGCHNLHATSGSM
jgi:hypothetical protein